MRQKEKNRMAYKSLQEIEERCRAEGISFSEAVLLDDLNERGVSREDSRTTMHGMWKAMKEASDGYDAALRSNSGLVGGAGGKMREYVEKEEPLSGGFVGKVISSALEMGESNACMKTNRRSADGRGLRRAACGAGELSERVEGIRERNCGCPLCSGRHRAGDCQPCIYRRSIWAAVRQRSVLPAQWRQERL